VSSSVFVALGMTGNYLLTNPLLRPQGTNNPYNTLLAETIVCNTPTVPVFHSPGVTTNTLLFFCPFVHVVLCSTMSIIRDSIRPSVMRKHFNISDHLIFTHKYQRCTFLQTVPLLQELIHCSEIKIVVRTLCFYSTE